MSVKFAINALNLVKIIINIVIIYHNFLDIIVIDKNLLFSSKFWLLLYYFYGTKQRFFITFYL